METANEGGISSQICSGRVDGNELELDSPIYDEWDFHIPTKTLLFNFISALYILTTTAHK